MCYLYYIILLTNTSSRNSCKIFAMEIIEYTNTNISVLELTIFYLILSYIDA